jgi:anti-sigma factor RsiW
MGNGMADQNNSIDITDEMLVAYLDGQASADEAAAIEKKLTSDTDVSARLALLDAGSRPFREAFDLMLEAAPAQKLQEQLEKARSTAATPNTVSTSRSGYWGWAMAACLVLAVGLGFAVGDRFARFDLQIVAKTSVKKPTIPKAKGWRQVVADYHALYSRETLVDEGGDARLQDQRLAAASTLLSIDLNRDQLTVKGLDYKRTQILRFKKKPLAQLAYLYDGKVPVAFCILPSGKPAHGPKQEMRNGMQVVHWIKGGFGFMLIGKVPADGLNKIARTLEGRFG